MRPWHVRVSFATLGLSAYLAGQAQFAFADYGVLLALTFAQYASIGALVTGVFHYAARLMRRRGNATKDRMGERETS